MILSRKEGETIVIRDNIEVTVVRIDGDKIRIGIVAPREVPVFRSEIYEKIQQENREASSDGRPS